MDPTGKTIGFPIGRKPPTGRDWGGDRVRLTEFRAKLFPLMRAVARSVARRPGFVETEQVQSFFDAYNRLRDALATEHPFLATDLPPRREPSRFTIGERPYVSGDDVAALANSLAYTVDLLDEHRDSEALPAVNREGLFIAGQEFDAFRQVGKILSPATRSIDVVDGYVDESVLDLLSAKKAGVEAKILTYQVSPAMKAAAEKFNKQHGGLAIRTSKAFHDRFLVLDDAEVFHFGHSIKDAGKRGFMFSRVEEPAVLRAFQDLWRKEWASAAPAVG